MRRVVGLAAALLDAGAGATLWLGIAGLLWFAGMALLPLTHIADRVSMPDASPEGSPGTPSSAPPSGDRS